MAAVTGEVALGSHRLRFATRELVRLEARLGKSITTAFADPGVTVIVAAVEIGAGLTEAQAFDLVDEMGVVVCGERVAEALTAAFPAVGDEGGEADPRQAA